MPQILDLKRLNLKYLDALTYLSIRSFHNSITNWCHPSYDKLIKTSGLSRAFIAKSINRLEDAGFISINRSNHQGRCNRYTFDDDVLFERIPYEIFETDDLTVYEKAMLICLRQFFNHGSLTSSWRVKEFAKYLGVTYKVVYGPFKNLLAKGYLVERHHISKSGRKSYYLNLTGKINWLYDYSNTKLLTPWEKLQVA